MSASNSPDNLFFPLMCLVTGLMESLALNHTLEPANRDFDVYAGWLCIRAKIESC